MVMNPKKKTTVRWKFSERKLIPRREPRFSRPSARSVTYLLRYVECSPIAERALLRPLTSKKDIHTPNCPYNYRVVETNKVPTFMVSSDVTLEVWRDFPTRKPTRSRVSLCFSVPFCRETPNCNLTNNLNNHRYHMGREGNV